MDVGKTLHHFSFGLSRKILYMSNYIFHFSLFQNQSIIEAFKEVFQYQYPIKNWMHERNIKVHVLCCFYWNWNPCKNILEYFGCISVVGFKNIKRTDLKVLHNGSKLMDRNSQNWFWANDQKKDLLFKPNFENFGKFEQSLK